MTNFVELLGLEQVGLFELVLVESNEFEKLELKLVWFARAGRAHKLEVVKRALCLVEDHSYLPSMERKSVSSIKTKKYAQIGSD